MGVVEHGCDPCDYPDFTLNMLHDGTVLYNSSEEIGGFQFVLSDLPCC